MMNKSFYVYILANKRNGTLYTGVTSSLIKRVYEHKNEFVDGFSKKYETKMLVYYEPIDSAEEAIRREKQIKAWKREWKLNHIEEMNPEWRDLYAELL
jgi:putative endonuclease